MAFHQCVSYLRYRDCNALTFAFHSASGDAIARTYNLALADPDPITPLTSEIVWNAFYLHALLCDKERGEEHLHVPHRGSQNERLNQALAERNLRMAGTGQPQWAHACDDCEKVIRTRADDGSETCRTSDVMCIYPANIH